MMKRMIGAEIRKMWLEFFQEKGHMVEPSASLIPVNDPTLLWINSGVATLKKYFDGTVIPDNPRITNSQKCIRTNDIENVGKTARHHTFFEMLGNFSIGEYFKREAITWAWELLTSPKWFALDKEKLYVTVYPTDKETYNIWLEIGVDPDHIKFLEGNFWEIGEGPCGPCTEIFFDRGEKYDLNKEGIRLLEEDLENDRYIEIWNIVLSQYNSKAGLDRSEYPELPKKNIDTGMGLERMACVLQEVDTNFDSDLFLPIIQKTEEISGVKYKVGNEENDVAFKVIADHIRTAAFAVADGALPSNDGRGYILRRLLRRAVRYGKKLTISKPFLADLVPVVAKIMEDFYPEVTKEMDFVKKVVTNEEERFQETLHDGETILAEVIQSEKAKGHTVIPGVDVFRLYDTYGFPVELTEEYAEESGMTVDHDGFAAEMEKQRERARSARVDVDSMQVQSAVLGEIKDESTFVGYNQSQVDTTVAVLLKDGEITTQATIGEEVQIILAETPFYAESGGQIADQGTITSGDFTGVVQDVQKAPNGQHLHRVLVESGLVTTRMAVTATLKQENRNGIVKNHTATHLLHQALKDVLGTHVNQAGSLVTPDRLRFDFSHLGQVQPEELEQIERIVNEKIWASLDVVANEMSMIEAREMGAMALFGEKYGDVVRVVQIDDYSIELCGGCHVDNTSSIGLFKIVSESGIGAGVRRIEAVTGKGAYVVMNDQVTLLKDAANMLKTNSKDILTRVDSLQGEIKQLQKERESLAAKLSNIEAGKLTDNVQEINGVKVLATEVNVADMNSLRNMMDGLKDDLGSAVIVLGAVNDGKVNILAGVTKDLLDKYHAGKLVKEVASRCGGGGGGRPDMAQAGAKNPDQLKDALAYVTEYVASI